MTYVVGLGSRANMQTIATIWSDLAEALETHDAITVDCTEVVDADLSIVQLLEAARGQAARSHKTLALAAPAGPAITAVLERGGFLTEPSPEFRDFWCHGDHSR